MGRGRAPCCQKVGLKKGPWSPVEDMKLVAYIRKHGHGNWRALPRQAGLLRCGKSCRLRWINYLRPDLKRGNFSPEEEETIIKLHSILGNKWSKIASRLPGRTDNEIKNVWNTYLKKRLMSTKPPKESSSSSSCNSLISHCNGADRAEQVEEEEPQETVGCESPPEAGESPSVGEIIEIPVETNVDYWDMLDDGSSHLFENVNINGNMCDTSLKGQSTSEMSDLSGVVSFNQAAGKGLEEGAHTQFKSGALDDVQDVIHSLDLEEFTQIPLDADVDFWGMLENDLCLIPSNVVLINRHEAHQNTATEENSRGEVDSKSWIKYLENELELWDTSNENQPSLAEGTSNPLGSFNSVGGLVGAEFQALP